MRYSRNSKHYSLLRAWLKTRRLEAGLTIRTLAERLDVPYSIVGRIEDGGRKLEFFEFIEYCDAVGVDPRDGFDAVLTDLDLERGE
jgi:transcriptional regulator with XRE-family HTH domain